MKILACVGLCCLLAGTATAQRGGGGGGHGSMGGGGGFHGSMGGGGGFRGGGGGFRGGGGGFRGGGGGFHGGGFNGFHGGFNGGFRGPFIGNGFRRFGGGGFGWGGWGYGGWPYVYSYPYYGSYWPDYYDSGYSPYISTYPYTGGGGYDYNYGNSSSPNVTVVYPPSSPPVQEVPVQSVIRNYDQYGQEINASQQRQSNSSPIYLIAMKSQVIYGASSYLIENKTLHFVNLQHESKQVPLDQVDRDLSIQLNRERHVNFQLPRD